MDFLRRLSICSQRQRRNARWMTMAACTALLYSASAIACAICYHTPYHRYLSSVSPACHFTDQDARLLLCSKSVEVTVRDHPEK